MPKPAPASTDAPVVLPDTPLPTESGAAMAPDTVDPAPEPEQLLYLGLADAPPRLVARVVRATADQAEPLLQANQVRLATPAEVELAAPHYLTLED